MCSSRKAVGSSSSSTWGSVASMEASSSRCACPCESCMVGANSISPRPYRVSSDFFACICSGVYCRCSKLKKNSSPTRSCTICVCGFCDKYSASRAIAGLPPSSVPWMNSGCSPLMRLSSVDLPLPLAPVSQTKPRSGNISGSDNTMPARVRA